MRELVTAVVGGESAVSGMSLSGMRRDKHWVIRIARSIPAAFNHHPCSGGHSEGALASPVGWRSGYPV